MKKKHFRMVFMLTSGIGGRGGLSLLSRGFRHDGRGVDDDRAVGGRAELGHEGVDGVVRVRAHGVRRHVQRVGQATHTEGVNGI